MPLDFEILNALQTYGTSPFGDAVMPIVSWLGNYGFVWLVLALVLLAFPKTRKIGIALVVAIVMVTLVCNLAMKPLVARVRPCDINTALVLLVPRPLDYSFPSGHTCCAFAAVSVLFFSKSKLWIPALFLASLIAFSRLYLYVHYPSDVLAGIVLGAFLGWLAVRFVRFFGSGREHRVT